MAGAGSTRLDFYFRRIGICDARLVTCPLRWFLTTITLLREAAGLGEVRAPSADARPTGTSRDPHRKSLPDIAVFRPRIGQGSRRKSLGPVDEVPATRFDCCLL
jgi:hypothetical protein